MSDFVIEYIDEEIKTTVTKKKLWINNEWVDCNLYRFPADRKLLKYLEDNHAKDFGKLWHKHFDKIAVEEKIYMWYCLQNK